MWSTVNALVWEQQNRPCSNFCATIGYCDDYMVMGLYRTVKRLLGWCTCVQLLKVIKFTDTMVPKMDLATSVLHHAAAELIFFSFVFAISLLAFSQVRPIPHAQADAV